MSELSTTAQQLWGKKHVDDDGNELWLPLIAHMIDTKNVINWLYNHWLNAGQRNILLKDFTDEEDLQNLVKFLGFIHDIGKATPAFQTKSSWNRSADLDDKVIAKLIYAGFEHLDQAYLEFPNKSPHALAGEVILEERGLNQTLGAIIGGHHGQPQGANFDYNDQYVNYKENYLQYLNPKEKFKLDIQDKWKSVQSELINYGLKVCNLSNLEKLPQVTEPQAVILNGLVIMADWLASSESIEKEGKILPMFPLIDIQEQFGDLGDMETRFENAIINWTVNSPWQPSPVNNVKQYYNSHWNFDPHIIQTKMSQAINEAADPGMIIIEAPMGIGKTEIALTAAEQLAYKTGKTGLFFGLPTQATSNAMFSRVESWLEDIAKSEQITASIKLMQSKAQFNDEYQAIPKTKNIYSEDSGSVVVNSWFSGKKSILSDFTIGTVDHLLLMGLGQKHLSLRHLGLSGKVVIIDEVHAYDVYMNSYLKKAIQWLGAYGVPVIALSATLPIATRNELLSAYTRGKFGKKKFIAENNWKENQSYPLLSILDGKELKQFDDFSSNHNITELEINRLNVNDEKLVDLITKKTTPAGVAGVIVNTVKRAQTLAKIFEENSSEDIQVLVLHSAFLATTRNELEQKLQRLIGKNGNRPKQLVVIGTQVLEQSLDIDFDVLFSDIAPMDLLLQRAGRLHRHQIARPQNLKLPKMYILGINDYGDYGEANEYIYEKYLLMKTDHFLPQKVKLPSDISTLVQKVYNKTTDEDVPEIRDAKEQFTMHQSKAKSKAKAYQISAPPRRIKSLHGWLDVIKDTENDENKAQAAVRDIQESIEVILLRHTSQGDYLVDGTPIDTIDDEIRDKVIARQLIRLPRALTWNIDKSIKKLETITQNYYPAWQESSWLRGAIVLPLDKNNETKFNGYKVSYLKDLGLFYEKIDAQ